MFQRIAIILLLVFCFSATKAQDDRPFRFGLKIAPNYGWLKPNIPEFEKDGVMPRLGFGYGLMGDIKFSESPNYLFSTGIEIAHHGGRLIEPESQTVDGTRFNGKVEQTYRLQYLNIPLLLKMRTNQIGYMNYFGAFGLDAGINLAARANRDYTWQGPANLQPEDEENVDIKNDIRALKLALNITVGAEYNISGNTNLYFGLSWHNGFTNVLKGRIIEPLSDGNPTLNDDGTPVISQDKKAAANYVSLDLGVFF